MKLTTLYNCLTRLSGNESLSAFIDDGSNELEEIKKEIRHHLSCFQGNINRLMRKLERTKKFALSLHSSKQLQLNRFIDDLQNKLTREKEKYEELLDQQETIFSSCLHSSHIWELFCD